MTRKTGSALAYRESQMKEDARDTAGVIVPPPLIYLPTLLVGLALHFAVPVSFLPGYWLQLAIGLPLIGASGIVVATAFRTMRRAGTEINVNKPTTAIVMQGPYRFSRNPMYLAMTLLYLGIAISLSALWMLVLVPIPFAIINLGVIKREERYLKQKFGQEYLSYKARVRRWL